MEFLGQISTIGKNDKTQVAIYIPVAYHKYVLDKFQGKTLRVILKDNEVPEAQRKIAKEKVELEFARRKDMLDRMYRIGKYRME
jgi:hypothetical protein